MARMDSKITVRQTNLTWRNEDFKTTRKNKQFWQRWKEKYLRPRQKKSERRTVGQTDTEKDVRLEAGIKWTQWTDFQNSSGLTLIKCNQRTHQKKQQQKYNVVQHWNSHARDSLRNSKEEEQKLWQIIGYEIFNGITNIIKKPRVFLFFFHEYQKEINNNKN